MKKCPDCRHYRTEKDWYTPDSYPCNTCTDEEMNFEPYPEGKTTFDPRRPDAEPAGGLIIVQPDKYRELAESFSKSIKNGKFLIRAK